MPNTHAPFSARCAIFCCTALLAAALAVVPAAGAAPAAPAETGTPSATAAPPATAAPAETAVPAFTPDRAYIADRIALDRLQYDAFRYMWDDAHPVSGMAYETNAVRGPVRIVAVGGTGFGIASIVVAADRGWITREQAVGRINTIATFLRDRVPRRQLHGALPHWLDGATGAVHNFSNDDAGADIVETALLMQGLLIARAYFNGPGNEEALRAAITRLWEEIDWDWFTNGEEIGLYWHWSQSKGFANGLRILGYNECLIAYVLALSSPTHPISRKNYDYWTSGKGYQPKDLYGYRVEASLAGGGPMFLAQYSFIGLDPRRMADEYVKTGYFVRNVKQTLSNRSYCLYTAPARNKYGEGVWGLTASYVKGGYAANEPTLSKDSGTVAPTAALSSMPYTPHYSMKVLENLLGPLWVNTWGIHGPYDAFSPRENWYSRDYLAIDQLPIPCMVENYRSGLLWDLLMGDPDIQRGLAAAGITAPNLAPGFPEAVVSVVRKGNGYTPDAYETRRHPDTGEYMIPYWAEKAGPVTFRFAGAGGAGVFSVTLTAKQGRNFLTFPQFMAPDGKILTLTMREGDAEYTLPVRLH